MKFALHIPLDQISPPGEFQTGAAVREIAAAVERAGASAALLSEHPAPDANWLHNDPTGHDALDPLTALAFVAAATTRLKLLTHVVVLPYRNPFITAKAAATLQTLSDGRLIMGVGAGYQKGEFEALGVPFAQRGALTDEALETIRLAWAGGVVVKEGRTFNAAGVEPRPAPSPPPPIWVGGGSDKAVERAARFGDGWAPFFSGPTNDPEVRRSAVVSVQHFTEKLDRLQNLRAKAGACGPFDVAVGGPFKLKSASQGEADHLLEKVAECENAGATWMWARVPSPSRAAWLENIAWFGEAVIAAQAGARA